MNTSANVTNPRTNCEGSHVAAYIRHTDNIRCFLHRPSDSLPTELENQEKHSGMQQCVVRILIKEWQIFLLCRVIIHVRECVFLWRVGGAATLTHYSTRRPRTAKLLMTNGERSSRPFLNRKKKCNRLWKIHVPQTQHYLIYLNYCISHKNMLMYYWVAQFWPLT